MVATCSVAPPSLITLWYAPTSAELMLSGEGGTRSTAVAMLYIFGKYRLQCSMLITPQASTLSRVQITNTNETSDGRCDEACETTCELDDGMSQSVKRVVAGRGRKESRPF